jgi:16S rRNA processing protein RimM
MLSGVERFLECGRIINTHGLHGEVRLEPWSDSPEFAAALPRIFIRAEEYAVERAKAHGRFVIIKLAGIDDVESAAKLKGAVACLDRSDVTLADGAYFIADAIGLTVVAEDGTEIGTLTDVLDRPAHDVFVVRGTGREHLVPNISEFVKLVDIRGGKIVVSLLDGM